MQSHIFNRTKDEKSSETCSDLSKLNCSMLCCCQDGNLNTILFQFTRSEKLIRNNQSVKKPSREGGGILLLANWISLIICRTRTSCSPQHSHHIPSPTVLLLSSIFTFQHLKWAVISDIQTPAVSRELQGSQKAGKSTNPPWRYLPNLWWERTGKQREKNPDFHGLQQI